MTSALARHEATGTGSRYRNKPKGVVLSLKIPSVRDLCRPHDDLHNLSLQETVLDISSLSRTPRPPQLDPDYFFSRNVFTAASKKLVELSLDRLSGNKGIDGVFLLSDGMGGGKTHSILTLGLLAGDPAVRARQLPAAAFPKIGSVKVVAFDGRSSGTVIWDEIGRQLGIGARFAPYLEPVQSIGKDKWGELLGDQGPLIIAIDELPPYLDDAQSRVIGDSNLSRVTATSLSNLIRGIADGGSLSQVVIVITDIASTAYQNSIGDWQVAKGTEALSNLRQEVDQVARKLQPVDGGSGELYDVLRKRCFASMPAPSQIAAVATARNKLLNDADANFGTATTGGVYESAVLKSYPFDPHLSEILLRTKDAYGFQGTRGLLRVMQAVVSEVFSDPSRLADVELIGPQHLSPGIGLVKEQISKVNPKMEAAILQGVSGGGQSAAEMIDIASPNCVYRPAERVATLILWASLSSAGAKTGVKEDEIISICIDSHTNADEIEAAIAKLVEESHYLYRLGEGNKIRYVFRDTENVRAAIAKRVELLTPDQWQRPLKERLEQYLKPGLRQVYDDCVVFPVYSQAKASVDRRTLFALAPDRDGGAERRAREWWAREELKGQVLFLYADPSQIEELEKTARRYAGTAAYERELRDSGVSEQGQQMAEVRDAKAAAASNLYQAITTAYRKLLFPSRGDLHSRDIERQDRDGKSIGSINEAPIETFVADSIITANKFQEEHELGSEFETRISTEIFVGDSILESDLRRAVASSAKMSWSVRDAIARLTSSMISAGRWRREGGFLTKVTHRPEARLTKCEQAQHADGVNLVIQVENAAKIEVSYLDGAGQPQRGIEKIIPGEDKIIPATAILMTLRAVAAAGGVEEGPKDVLVIPKITYRIERRGLTRVLVAHAAPKADLAATSDGSVPNRQNGTIFTGELPIPDDCRRLRLAALRPDGRDGGILGKDIIITVGEHAEENAPHALKNVRATDRLQIDVTLQAVEAHEGKIGGLILNASHGLPGSQPDVASFSHTPGMRWLTSAQVRAARDLIDRTVAGEGQVAKDLSAQLTVAFPTLRAVEAFCAAADQKLNRDIVEALSAEDFAE